jgi:hypothetical protein
MHLTYRDLRRNKVADRPTIAEPELTEAMIAAGAEALVSEFGGDSGTPNHFWNPHAVATSVFQAMMSASPEYVEACSAWHLLKGARDNLAKISVRIPKSTP